MLPPVLRIVVVKTGVLLVEGGCPTRIQQINKWEKDGALYCERQLYCLEKALRGNGFELTNPLISSSNVDVARSCCLIRGNFKAVV